MGYTSDMTITFLKARDELEDFRRRAYLNTLKGQKIDTRPEYYYRKVEDCVLSEAHLVALKYEVDPLSLFDSLPELEHL
jgi:hypothetical protein